MTPKKKLLVLTGAGASVDFGMPNVADVSNILSDATRDRFPLLFDQSRGLFDYFEDQLAEHWRLRGRLSPSGRPTFEDVLLAIFETAGALDDKGFASPSTAFLSVRPFPDLGFDRSTRFVADDNVIREFGAIAVDSLLGEFRKRCVNAEADRAASFALLRGLVSALSREFELSFATLNYDDVLYSTPTLLTHTPARCRVIPVAGIKLGIGRRLCVASDAEQRTEGVERVEAPVEPKREFVEVGL